MKTLSEMTTGKQVLQGPIFKGIDKICGKDDLRPIFKGAYITEGKIVATDAHHLVEIDLKLFGIDQEGKNDLENKFIDTDILIELSKLKKDQYYFINNEGFHLVRSGTSKISRSYPVYDISDTGNYPKYKNIIPDGALVPIDTFNVSAKLLLNIQNVFDNISLFEGATINSKINTYGANKALLVINKEIVIDKEYTIFERDFLGLLMPCKVD